MQIIENCIVSIHYTLTNEQGELLDKSKDGEPLVYLHGAAGIVPALEIELAGKAAGDSFDVTIAPDGGFGERQPELLQEIPRSAVPSHVDLQVGAQLEATSERGGSHTGIVKALDAATITIDFNHPLAGMTLRFKGNIDSVREASDDEVKYWPNPVGPEEPTG